MAQTFYMLKHKLKEETIVNIFKALNSQILNPMRLTLNTTKNNSLLKYKHAWIEWEHNVNPGWLFIFLNCNK